MLIHEAVRPVLLSEQGAEGKDWEVVIIQPGWSLNDAYYPVDVLKKAVPLFEGLRVCAYRFGEKLNSAFDHLPDKVEFAKPEGFAVNEVGFLENARYGGFSKPDGTKGEGVLARFHVLEGADWLRKNLRDAWQHGHSEILGFSINARGDSREALRDGRKARIVDCINKVVSTEVVTEPAAGGEVLRLVASAGKEEKIVEGHKDLLGLIRKNRPQWLEGFSDPAAGEDMKGVSLRVLEANLERAQKAQAQIPEDDSKRLAEVARGVNTLRMMLELLKQDKVAEAMKMLQDWIEAFPVDEEKPVAEEKPAAEDNPVAEEKDDTKTQASGSYSIPYSAPEKQQASKPTEKTGDDDMSDKVKEKEQELAVRESKLRIREKLAEAKLPEQAQKRVEALLASKGSGLKDEDIDTAIEEERTYIASLSESGKPTGLGDSQDETPVAVGAGPADKLEKAFEGMFANEDVDGVPRITSLHRAFYETHRPGYLSQDDLGFAILESIALGFPGSPNREMERHSARLREGWKGVPKSSLLREAVGTGDWSVAFGQALFKRLQKVYKDDPLNDWRQIISSIENLADATNTYSIVRLGGYGVLPTVAEKAPYQELTDPTEATEVITPAKKGALAKFTWEDALADRIGVLRRIPTMLGRAAARTVSELVWDQIDTNPDMADSNALISTAHVNHTTTTLSYAAVVTAIQKLRDQTEQDSSKKLGFNPALLLVSPTKEGDAIEITDSVLEPRDAASSTRSVVNRLGVKTFSTLGLGRGGGNTPKYWYLAASPRDSETIAVGFLGGRDRPDLFVQSPVDTPTSGAAFEADALTFKIRLVVGARVVDWRWIQGNLATT